MPLSLWSNRSNHYTMTLRCLPNGPDHPISYHLNTKQVKVCYSDKFVIQMFTIPNKLKFAIKINLLFKCLLFRSPHFFVCLLNPPDTWKFPIVALSVKWCTFNICFTNRVFYRLQLDWPQYAHLNTFCFTDLC